MRVRSEVTDSPLDSFECSVEVRQKEVRRDLSKGEIDVCLK